MSAAPPFSRLLIANRGEIAVRIIRACRELGVRSIAVYSEVDHGALHTRLADEAHLLGPAPASESYLHVARILDVARQAEAQALHPGYGFLAENAELAEACMAAGIVFVGPPPGAMRLLGDKAAARRLAAREGVPVVPGYDGPDQSPEALLERAREIGFPLLIKAAAGGGGRGMRVVEDPAAFADALESARREASAAFGEGTMILERYLAPARHVEVQVLGDRHGAMVHLGERECSVQRRYQKVIEESPAPGCTPALRARLGAAAVQVARAAGYENAGTCEFLLDAEGGFYFIEMNARLQVEHPVTELVTGLDLVKRQLAVAAGEPLGLEQVRIVPRGHAIEVRLYAEDPARGFLPSGGRLERFEPPLGPGLRHDVGYETGDSVNTFYDAMLAKTIAYGEDRATALARAREAVDGYRVEGVATNLSLLRWIVRHPTFVAGEATTGFLERAWRPPDTSAPPPEALAAAAAFELAARAGRAPESSSGAGDPWEMLGPWRVSEQAIPLAFEVGDAPRLVFGSRPGDDETGGWVLTIGEMRFAARANHDGRVVVERDGTRAEFRVEPLGGEFRVDGGTLDESYHVRRAGPPSTARGGARTTGSTESAGLVAPMPGRVVRVMVGPGDRVREHQPLILLEAMKIEHTVAAHRAGVVRAVRCRAGDQVDGGALLVEMGE